MQRKSTTYCAFSLAPTKIPFGKLGGNAFQPLGALVRWGMKGGIWWEGGVATEVFPFSLDPDICTSGEETRVRGYVPGCTTGTVLRGQRAASKDPECLWGLGVSWLP